MPMTLGLKVCYFFIQDKCFFIQDNSCTNNQHYVKTCVKCCSAENDWQQFWLQIRFNVLEHLYSYCIT